MYVAVKGGEQAIDNAHRLLSKLRRGDPTVLELTIDQIRQQMPFAVDRVMNEGSLCDPELAALAIKQAAGDLVEAIFLLRAYRTTLPRLAVTEPIDTNRMRIRRRISAAFKDVPGGQVLGPTFDYTHRLLDFTLAAETLGTASPIVARPAETGPAPRISELLDREGLIERAIADDTKPVGDITRSPLDFPAGRDIRLQSLARADEGFLLALGYSTQRGYANSHPFVGEIRVGDIEIEIEPSELGFPIVIGEITVTECEMINQFHGSKSEPPQFTRGYGLAFGYCERRTMSMALVDRALRWRELDEELVSAAAAQDHEFVLYHADNVEASGFVQHLKLPHYVDFQSELELVRKLRRSHELAQEDE